MGRILVWHLYSGQDAETLSRTISTFSELHPEVIVKQKSYSDPALMLEEFARAMDSGLGPDMVIGPTGWIPRLVDKNALLSLSNEVEEEIVPRFMPATIEMVRYDDKLWGLPHSVDTLILYYKTDLVTSPPKTLEQLEIESDNGHIIDPV